MLAKAKDLSLLHTWSLRRKRRASEISIQIVEADLGISFVFCSCCGDVDSSLRYRKGCKYIRGKLKIDIQVKA